MNNSFKKNDNQANVGIELDLNKDKHLEPSSIFTLDFKNKRVSFSKRINTPKKIFVINKKF